MNREFKYTQKTFLEAARDVYGDRYDYSLVAYIDLSSKIQIMCSIHGTFEQYPYHHLNGNGCKKCGIDERVKNRIELTQIDLEEYFGSEFIRKFQFKHLGHEKAKIICEVHGEQIVGEPTLKRNKDCPKCAHEKRNPEILVWNDWKQYIQEVRKHTDWAWKNKNGFFRHYGEKRGRTDYHIDHEFSMLEGFRNNVPPEIIGHWTNLHMIPYIDNIRKRDQSTKTLETLYVFYEWGKLKHDR